MTLVEKNLFKLIANWSLTRFSSTYHSWQDIKNLLVTEYLTIDDFSDEFNGSKRDFEIFTDNKSVFQIEFNGSDNTRVVPGEGTINLTNHYFVSGEVVEYIPPNNDPANAINITPTDFGPGIGTTTLLPSRITIIKQDNQKVRVATSATNALLFNPIGVGLTGVGIGSTHIFKCLNTNNRLLITVNGTIQSPMVGTAYTTALIFKRGNWHNSYKCCWCTSIFGGDLLEQMMRLCWLQVLMVSTMS